jgi:hypothetical protein
MPLLLASSYTVDGKSLSVRYGRVEFEDTYYFAGRD